MDVARVCVHVKGLRIYERGETGDRRQDVRQADKCQNDV